MFFKKIYLYLFLSALVGNSNTQCISPMLKNLIGKKDSKKFTEYLSKISIDQPAIKELHEFIDSEINKVKLEQKGALPSKKDCYRILMGSALITVAYWINIKSKLTEWRVKDVYADDWSKNMIQIMSGLKQANPNDPAFILLSSLGATLACNIQKTKYLLKSLTTKLFRAVFNVTGGWMIIKGLLKSDNRRILNELAQIKKAIFSYERTKLSILNNKPS